MRARESIRRGALPATVLAGVLAAGAGLGLAGCASSPPGDASGSRASPAEVDPEQAERAHEAARAALAAGRLDEAHTQLERAADLGHAEAAYDLSVLHGDPASGAPDLGASARWLNEAARLGSPRAQFVVGAALYAEDDESLRREGVEHLLRAARAGHDRAEYLVGQAYARGEGVARDPAWGARWTARAAARGHAGAQRAVGLALMSGIGVPRDIEGAYVWLSLAAANGESRADRIRDALGARLDERARTRADARAAAFRPAGSLPFADRATVAYVQAQLSALGFDPGPVDGLLGPRTRSAVRAYQERVGLAATGELSEPLVARLRDT